MLCRFVVACCYDETVFFSTFYLKIIIFTRNIFSKNEKKHTREMIVPLALEGLRQNRPRKKRDNDSLDQILHLEFDSLVFLSMSSLEKRS